MRLLRGNRHRRWQRELSAYIDGYLEPRQEQALQDHLADCASCQQELEALQGVVALLHRVPQVPAPRSFALSQVPVRETWWGVRYAATLRYATAAAALLLLAVAVGDLATGRQSSIATSGGPAAMERSLEQAPEGLRDEPSLAATDLATEETPLPRTVSSGPSQAAATPDDAKDALEETSPAAQEPEQPGSANALYRQAEVALGTVLALLAALVAIQWWLGRRARLQR